MEKIMKYFFFDIDGTLLYKDEHGKIIIPVSTITTLKELKKHGHFVAIATSRPYVLTKDTAKQLSIDNFVCDGGDGYCLNGKLIEILPLEKEYCIDLAHQAINHGMSIAVSIDTTNNRYSNDGVFINRNRYLENAFDFVTKKDFDIDTVPAVYKMCIDVSIEQEYLLPTLLKVPHYRISQSCILVEAIDKYQGIKKIIKHIDGKLSDVVVFGDGLNDLSMFNQAAYSIAMGNACQEIKKIANFITKDSKEDGIYQACRYHQWI